MLSEQAEQMNFILWFKRNYPHVLIHHSPNGGARNKREGAKFKRMGTLAGFPDLFIPAWHLFIEFKRVKGGRLSGVQKTVMAQLESDGYFVEVAHGNLDAQRIIKNYLHIV